MNSVHQISAVDFSLTILAFYSAFIPSFIPCPSFNIPLSSFLLSAHSISNLSTSRPHAQSQFRSFLVLQFPSSSSMVLVSILLLTLTQNGEFSITIFIYLYISSILWELQNDIGLLNPPFEFENRKHKFKRLFQSPSSFFMWT